MTRNGLLFWAGALAFVVLLALAAGGPPDDGMPFDPDATGPLGAKGLVLTLRELGADVRVADAPPADAAGSSLLVLVDRLDEDQLAAARSYAAAGGTLVVADPSSTLQPSGPVGDGGDDVLSPRCGFVGVAEVQRVDPSGGAALAPSSAPGSVACFPNDDGYLLVASPIGRGRIVGIGGPGLFVNSELGDHDHAVLAAALLAPEPGWRTTVLRPPVPGEGPRTLGDLVAPRVKLTLVQLGVAFLVVVLWRVRRLGRPVAEPTPTPIEGSELVLAVGNLLQHSGDAGEAARVMRDAARRELGERVGAGATASADEVAAAVSAAGTLDEAEVRAALAHGPVDGDAGLVAIAHTLDDIRQEVLHGNRP